MLAIMVEVQSLRKCYSTFAFITPAAYLFRWEAAKNQNGKAKKQQNMN